MYKGVGKNSDAEKLEAISMFTMRRQTPLNKTSLAENVDLHLTLKETHGILRRRLYNSEHGMTPLWKRSLYLLIHGTESRSTYNIFTQEYSFFKRN